MGKQGLVDTSKRLRLVVLVQNTRTFPAKEPLDGNNQPQLQIYGSNIAATDQTGSAAGAGITDIDATDINNAIDVNWAWSAMVSMI